MYPCSYVLSKRRVGDKLPCIIVFFYLHRCMNFRICWSLSTAMQSDFSLSFFELFHLKLARCGLFPVGIMEVLLRTVNYSISLHDMTVEWHQCKCLRKPWIVCWLEVELWLHFDAVYITPADDLSTQPGCWLLGENALFAVSAGSRRKELASSPFCAFSPHAPYMGMEFDRAQRLLGKNAEIQEERGRSPVRACTLLRPKKYFESPVQPRGR